MKALFGLIALSLILAFSLAWTFRYHIVVGNDPLTVYSVDRWTGEVSLIAPEPAVRSLTSQSLTFVRAPLVRLRDTAYQDKLMAPFLNEADSDAPPMGKETKEDADERE